MSLLSVKNLGKSFGGVKAVDGISFDLAAGELLALIGPNGAGKSTTFNMVNGQLRADQGSILLDGQELVGRQPRAIWRLGVGRTFQIAETFASLTVVENVQMALLSHDGKLFSMWRRAADYRRADALALLDQVGVELAVNDAVLAFLADEVLDLGQQFRVGDLIAEVAHARDEEALTFREDGGHGVAKAGLERIAAQPVLRDVLVESERQLLARHDVRVRGDGRRRGVGHGTAVCQAETATCLGAATG